MNKNNRSLLVLVSLLLLLAMAGTATSQGTGLTIYTKYLLGYPIPNASVYIDDNYAGMTDENGALFLASYPQGTHNITTTHENYENATKEVDLSQETEVTMRMQDRAQVIPPGAMMIYARENTESRNLICSQTLQNIC